MSFYQSLIRVAIIFSRPFLETFWGHFGLQIGGFSGTKQHNSPTQQNIDSLLKYLISIIRWGPDNTNIILTWDLSVSVTPDKLIIVCRGVRYPPFINLSLSLIASKYFNLYKILPWPLWWRLSRSGSFKYKASQIQAVLNEIPS